MVLEIGMPGVIGSSTGSFVTNRRFSPIIAVDSSHPSIMVREVNTSLDIGADGAYVMATFTRPTCKYVTCIIHPIGWMEGRFALVLAA